MGQSIFYQHYNFCKLLDQFDRPTSSTHNPYMMFVQRHLDIYPLSNLNNKKHHLMNIDPLNKVYKSIFPLHFDISHRLISCMTMHHLMHMYPLHTVCILRKLWSPSLHYICHLYTSYTSLFPFHLGILLLYNRHTDHFL